MADVCNASLLDKHEEWLRKLISSNFTPIYIGDTVQVSERWSGDSRNPHQGKIGTVDDVEAGFQAMCNIEYLVYSAKTPEGKQFQAYHYTLDRIAQPAGNQLLEKLLREKSVHN